MQSSSDSPFPKSPTVTRAPIDVLEAIFGSRKKTDPSQFRERYQNALVYAFLVTAT